MRSIFFGSSRFSVAVLEELEAAGVIPVLVVTSPEKPRGRGLALSPSPVGAWAKERGIDTLTPARLDGAFLDEIRNTEWDLFLVASYGHILPKELLAVPKRGTLNVHPSLLPKFRGASPVRSAILADERKTGVTIMEVDEKLDHGPIVAQASIEIESGEWPPKASALEELLAREGGKLLAETIPSWISGKITPEPQDESAVTYTKKWTKEDAKVDLAGDSHQNLLTIKAFDENPTAYFIASRGGKTIRVKITDADVKDGKLVVKRVIPEGGREMGYEDFKRGATSSSTR